MDARPATDLLTTYFRGTSVPLVCAYLFGSYARGEERPNSDVDVAVLFPADASSTLIGPLAALRGDLERSLGRQVDLIDMRRAPVDLIHRILREGHLLVERDRAERVRFEVQARNEYFDLLPYLRAYRKAQAA
jgi:hypothetical protein